MKPDTVLTHAGRDPMANHGIVNPPVYHASTVLFPSLAALEESGKDPYAGVHYGRKGTPTTFAFEEAVAELEGGFRGTALPSGLAAITVAIMAFVRTGDHVLMPDNVYAPSRSLCSKTLHRFGIETSYYDPMVGARIADLIRPNTRVVYLETPGSLTFEMPDVPAIAAAARAAGARVVLDNTWATPLYFRPFDHGVDVSVHAATKYIVGHSDVMMGMVTATEDCWRPVRDMASELGYSVGPDDCYLALRGLRTMSVRLARHQETGLALARWLADRPEVARVMHPALPQDPGHTVWKRDFTGASGLFGFVLNPAPKRAVAAMVDDMKLFGMGYSWGGFESLLLPTSPEKIRTATRWDVPGPTMRVHAGLEDVGDLIADLEAGFDRLGKAL
jgi:cystathionine beta-lyase